MTVQLEYDIEASFQFIGRRKNNVYQGYRPAHLVKEGCLTTGVHNYYDMNEIDGEMRGTVTFISPEDYPSCLWVGKRIEMYEGSKMIGYATILQIFNSILEKK